MADFSVIRSQWNSTATDAAAPVWNTITFGGSAGANEIRWTSTGGGAAGTASASWPQFSRPGSTAAVPELWYFTADTTGVIIPHICGSAHILRLWRQYTRRTVSRHTARSAVRQPDYQRACHRYQQHFLSQDERVRRRSNSRPCCWHNWHSHRHIRHGWLSLARRGGMDDELAVYARHHPVHHA